MKINSVVETTSPKAAAVKYKKKWLQLRESKSIDSDGLWIFTDGSSSGWHAAVIVDRRCNSVTKLADYADPKSNNVGPELWALLLALASIDTNQTITVVHDFIGTGAWLVGAWEIKSQNVRDAVDMIKSLLALKDPSSIRFIHHPGHQKDDSDFTRWNNIADRLCTAKKRINAVESITSD